MLLFHAYLAEATFNLSFNVATRQKLVRAERKMKLIGAATDWMDLSCYIDTVIGSLKDKIDIAHTYHMILSSSQVWHQTQQCEV